MFNGIDKEKIELNSFQLNKQETDILTIYDRYELKFRLKTGEEKIITLYADKGTVPEIIPDEYNGRENEFQSKIREFFFRTLFQRNKSESRIYIGSFNYKDNSKPVNDIYSITKDGFMRKQDLFDNLIEALKLYENGEITYEEFIEGFPELTRNQELKESENSVEDRAKEFRDSLNPDNYDEEIESSKIGKHYALGDIHGYKGPYDTALKMINPEDSLVLLGDVIDRGPNGIDILQDLIRRKANTPESKITFILGNHEKMMFDALNYILRLNLSSETISNIISYFNANRQRKNIYANYEETGEGDIKLAEYLGVVCTEIKEKIEQMMSETGYSINVDRMIGTIGIWCQSKNGGVKTLQAFMQLNEDEQKKICEFLRTSYVMKQQNIEEKEILFVHSRPPRDINLVKKLKESNDGGIRANQFPYDELNFVVWDREIDTYSPCKSLGLEMICGHEYEFNTSIVNRQKGYKRLDEGCGHRGSSSVGLYCIEDDTITHIGQDGRVFDANCNGKIKIIDERGHESIIEGSKIPTEFVR